MATVTERYAQSRATQGATTTFSPTGTIVVGSKVILACTTGGVDGKLPSTVTDTQSNTWVVDVSYNAVASLKNIAFVSCEVTTQMTTGTTITINWAVSTNNQVHVWLLETTGLATSSPFDKSATGTALNTTLITGSSGTLSQADEIVFACARQILLQCSHSTGHLDRNVIVGNNVYGNNVTNSRGVSLNNASSGSVDRNLVGMNVLRNLATAVYQNGDTNSLLSGTTWNVT